MLAIRPEWYKTRPLLAWGLLARSENAARGRGRPWVRIDKPRIEDKLPASSSKADARRSKVNNRSGCQANQPARFAPMALRSDLQILQKTGIRKNKIGKPDQRHQRFHCSHAKISLYENRKLCILPAIPHSSRGAYASSRTLSAGCDGRLGAVDERAQCGRQRRVVLIPRSWDQPLGLKSPGGTVARKARTPGRARISRNTIAQGRPGRSG
jgi:hypothetical protein